MFLPRVHDPEKKTACMGNVYIKIGGPIATICAVKKVSRDIPSMLYNVIYDFIYTYIL